MMKPKRIIFIGANHPKLELFCPHWNGVQKGLSRLSKELGFEYKFVSCRPSLDIEEIKNFEPDLIIYGLIDLVKKKDWRRQIRDENPNAKIVMWYGDMRDERTSQIDADCSEMDAMFVSNHGQDEYYRWKWKMPVVHGLPLGCEPIEEPVLDPRFELPFVFIGGQISRPHFGKRAEFIQKFREESDLKLFNSFEDDMRAKIFEAMPAIYSTAKVSLDVSHFTDVNKYTSVRYWEIPAFWGFALTKRFPGCEDFYPERMRAYFDTFEEAIEKRDYYLSHEEERKKMLIEAHEHSYNHRYDNRFRVMFEKL